MAPRIAAPPAHPEHAKAMNENIDRMMGETGKSQAEEDEEEESEEEPPPQEPGEVDDDEPQALDDDDEDEDEEEEGPDAGDEETTPDENTEPEVSALDVAEATAALLRDGMPQRFIKLMSPAELVASGLTARKRQADGDRVRSELGRLRAGNGRQTDEESETGNRSGIGQPHRGADDPDATGANLTVSSLPLAQKLAALDDPAEISKEMDAYQEQVRQGILRDVKATMQAEIASLRGLEHAKQTLREKLGPGFKGDIDALAPVAAALAEAGMHADKGGIDRAAALMRSAYAAQGKPVAQGSQTSTSRARKRGSAPPLKATRSAPKKLTAEQKLDMKLDRITRGIRGKGVNQGID